MSSTTPTQTPSQTVEDRYRSGDVPLTMAQVIVCIGTFDNSCPQQGYFWQGKDDAIVRLTPEGEINVDFCEVKKIKSCYREPILTIIGWAVAHRVPCVLHDIDTSRKAWRP